LFINVVQVPGALHRRTSRILQGSTTSAVRIGNAEFEMKVLVELQLLWNTSTIMKGDYILRNAPWQQVVSSTYPTKLLFVGKWSGRMS